MTTTLRSRGLATGQWHASRLSMLVGSVVVVFGEGVTTVLLVAAVMASVMIEIIQCFTRLSIANC